MGCRSVGTLLPVMVALELMGSGVAGQDRRDSLPENLEVHPTLQMFVDRMWERSPTFRRQGRRLAAERRLHVRLLVEELPSRRLEFHARSLLISDGAALVSARLYVGPGPDAVEHIAHELEHVLEQLDGVDLRDHEASGMAWKSGDGSYETRRAKEVGASVAREVVGIRHGVTTTAARAARADGAFVHARQRDRVSTWGTRPSARVSGNGRYVVFVSSAPLAAEDGNDLPDIYVVDLATGQISLESVGRAGAAADGWSANPDISADGRFVAFESTAGNLTDVPGESGEVQVFLRDRHAEVTRLLSANTDGAPANGFSRHASISADGSAVVFESMATDLMTPTSTQATPVRLYLVRLASGERVRIDVPANGRSPTGPGMSPALSADGRFVAFASQGDLAGENDVWPFGRMAGMRRVPAIYVRDTHLQLTTRISNDATGSAFDRASYHPAISADGRYVVFASEATIVAARRGSPVAQIYVHDRETGTTELVSRRPDGRPADGASRFPVVSADGSIIAFQSLASNLMCTKRCADSERAINLVSDVYVLDRATGAMTRASQDGSGVEWMTPSRGPSLDQSGRVLSFSSRHPIDDGDLGDDDDLYVRYTASRPSAGILVQPVTLPRCAHRRISNEVAILRARSASSSRSCCSPSSNSARTSMACRLSRRSLAMPAPSSRPWRAGGQPCFQRRSTDTARVHRDLTPTNI